MTAEREYQHESNGPDVRNSESSGSSNSKGGSVEESFISQLRDIWRTAASSSYQPAMHQSETATARDLHDVVVGDSDGRAFGSQSSSIANLSIGQLHLPKKLGYVRLLEPIGAGAMGVVWRGYDIALDRAVAVKFLLRGTECVQGESSGILDGTRAAARIDHPGLTSIYHADQIQETPYLIMEYINGVDLHEIKVARVSLALEEALVIMSHVSEAVGALHDGHVLHRDIKPSNTLLQRDGRIRVTDFGLSMPWDWHRDSQDRMAGTPCYMAPETFEGRYSPRSDVYSLGVMTYELLTGHVPFIGTIKELRHQHQHAEFPVSAPELSDVPDDLISIMRRATNKNHLLRFKTASHFARAVGSVSEHPRRIDHASILLSLLTKTQTDGTRRSVNETERSDSSTSYYEQIATISEKHRITRHKVTEECDPSARIEAESESPCSRTMEGRIPFDLACLNCSYNLRSLPLDADCVECGAPITSTVSRQLKLANPIWLRKLRVGLSMTGLASIGFFVWFSLAITGVLNRGVPFILGPVFLGMFFLWGVWQVSAPEPMDGNERSLSAQRFRVRFWMVTAVLCYVCFFLKVPKFYIQAAQALSYGIVLPIAIAIGFWSMLNGLSSIAMRIPSPKIAAGFRRLRIPLILILVANSIGVELAENLYRRLPFYVTTQDIAVVLLSASFLAFSLMFVNLWRLRRQVRINEMWLSDNKADCLEVLSKVERIKSDEMNSRVV